MSTTDEAQFQVDAPAPPAPALPERTEPRPPAFNPGSWRPAPPAPADPDRPRNVIEAIARVMREMPGVGKDSRADPAQGGYAYRGIEAITASAQRLMGRYGVVFVLRELEQRVEPITVNSKPWTDTYLTCEYDVYGPGGVADKITVGPITAVGRDNSDKGFNKCRTQALKYALLQTFCIGDSNDDADHGSPGADRSSAAERAGERRDVQAHDLGWADGSEMDDAHRQLIDGFRPGGHVHTALGADRAREAWKECPRRPMDRATFDAYAEWVTAQIENAGAESPQEPPEPPDSPTPAPTPEPAEDGQEAPDPAATAGFPPGTGVDADAPPPKPKPDGAERAEVAALVTAMVKGASTDLVDRVAEAVKPTHHTAVDRQLRDLGWDPEGKHIDSRRMMLTGLLVSADLHPDRCIMFGCDRPAEPDERHCSDHVPL